jgi:hypothetical protein
MFSISHLGNYDYIMVERFNHQNEFLLLGTQIFNALIIDIIYAADGNNGNITMIAFSDGKVLKIKDTGGTGQKMFNINETTNNFSAGNGYSYYLGDAKFTNGVTVLKYYGGTWKYTFIGLMDGKLLKINNVGGNGTDHNMFKVTELSDRFNPIPNSHYWVGDAHFFERVTGMEFISGFLFIWFSGGKLLKINGLGGANTNFINTYLYHNPSPGYFSAIPGHVAWYVGDFKFASNVRTVKSFNDGYLTFLLIGFDNGKILKVANAGGAGFNMFGVTEYQSGFNPTFNTSYMGDAIFPRHMVTQIDYLFGYLMIALDGGSYGMLLKINGFGEFGFNMFKLEIDNIIPGSGIAWNNIFTLRTPLTITSLSNYNYFIGSSFFIAGVTGFNFINNSSFFIEFRNRFLLKVRYTGSGGIGGIGSNILAVTMTQNSFIPTLIYYLGDQEL